jgi:hypothetical protein
MPHPGRSGVDAGAPMLPLAILETVHPIPPEVPVGAGIALKVKASCAAGSNPRGGFVNVVTPEGIVATVGLAAYRDDSCETAEFTVKAPDQVGEVNWTLLFPRQEIDGVTYAETAHPISFRTRPHRTSLAIWAVPSPVQVAERFSITVGAKSSGACNLAGGRVAILDENDAEIGHAMLGDMPWPDTSALYWARIELAAPPREGTFSWRAAFAARELALPHSGASAGFSFAAAKRPEHRLTLKVVDSETAAPLDEVEVALGPYRAVTDDAGLAKLDMPAGHYGVAAWKSGFEAPPITIEITQDTQVEVTLKRLPEEIKAWG